MIILENLKTVTMQKEEKNIFNSITKNKLLSSLANYLTVFLFLSLFFQLCLTILQVLNLRFHLPPPKKKKKNSDNSCQGTHFETKNYDKFYFPFCHFLMGKNNLTFSKAFLVVYSYVAIDFKSLLWLWL